MTDRYKNYVKNKGQSKGKSTLQKFIYFRVQQ